MCKELAGAAVGTALRNPLPTTGTRKATLVSVVGRLTATKFLEIMLSMTPCAVESVSEVGTFDGAPNAAIGLGVARGVVSMLYFYAVKTSPIGLIVMGKGTVRIVVDCPMCAMSESGGKNLVTAPKDVDL